MATNYFNLPTVDPDSTLSFPDAVNGLAIATDDVLQMVQNSFGSIDVGDLPVASTKELGLVRVGTGFRVFSDGSLSTTASPFKLRPATNNELGGVYIGQNVDVADGAISIGFNAFNTESIGAASLSNGGVETQDFANQVVTADKIEGRIVNDINRVETLFGASDGFQVSAYNSTYYPQKSSLTLFTKISEHFYFAYQPFSLATDRVTELFRLTDQSDVALAMVAGHNITSSLPPKMNPGALFTTNVRLVAYGYVYANNKWTITRTIEVNIDGARSTADVRNHNISAQKPTHVYMPPTIIRV